jgi:catalase
MSQRRDPAAEQLADYASAAKNTAGKKILTDGNGSPVDSLTNTQTAGPRGPIVLQDFNFMDHWLLLIEKEFLRG